MVGQVRVQPFASWHSENLRGAQPACDAFLTAAPEGFFSTTTFGISTGIGSKSVELRYRARTGEVESSISRSAQSAGRLSYADFSFSAWSAEVRSRQEERQWRVALRRESLAGNLSARLETWPFASLWETLSVQAYRLNGDIRGAATTATLTNQPVRSNGWSWGVDLGRYVARASSESWYVSGFGFARRDRQASLRGFDPGYFLGGQLGRSVSILDGSFDVEAAAGVPIHVRELHERTDRSIGGYAAVTVSWTS
jgi:hypothetical protein